MPRTRTLSSTTARCPSCESSDYFVYRREPAGAGRILNRCRCQTCDTTFSYEEDKVGHVLDRR